MDYTSIYKKIYSSLINDNLSHDEIHRFAIRITDVINELVLVTKHHDQQVIDTVSQIANQLWNPLNLGGFDLDDRND